MRKSIFLLSLLLSFSLFAEDDSDTTSTPFFADGVVGYDAPGDLQMGYSAAARMMPSNALLGDWNLSIAGAFLYWNVNQQGMEIVRRLETQSLANSIAAVKVRTFSHSFGYQPGFYVFLESSLGTDNWLGMVRYKRINSIGEREIDLSIPATAPLGTSSIANSILPTVTNIGLDITGTVTPTITSTFSAAVTNSIDTRWTMNLNLIDILMSRPFFSGRKLICKPSAGIRFGWLDQRWNISSDNFALANAITPSSTTAPSNTTSTGFETDMTSEAWLVGPFLSLDYTWLLGFGFQVTGYIAGSVFQQNPTVEIDSRVTGALTLQRLSDEGGNLPRLRSSLESGMGLAWGSYMVDDSINTRLAIRYDFMYIFNQNFMASEAARILRSEIVRPGNLGLHGLTILLVLGA